MKNKCETLEEVFQFLMNGYYKDWTPYRITKECGLSPGVIARMTKGDIPVTHNVVQSMCTCAGLKMKYIPERRPREEVEIAKKALFKRLEEKQAKRKPRKSLIKG